MPKSLCGKDCENQSTTKVYLQYFKFVLMFINLYLVRHFAYYIFHKSVKRTKAFYYLRNIVWYTIKSNRVMLFPGPDIAL